MAFCIGSLPFDGSAWLAPLASVTSAPFRQICLELACGQAVTEMVSSEALIRDVRKIARRMQRAQGEMTLVVQLFGALPEVMAGAAVLAVQQARADIIDINMGCPVRKILGTGAGVALMRDPDRAAAIVERVARAVGPSVPVTVKMRAGWNDEVNATTVARKVVEAGAQAITVHGRTREQYHTGETRWDVIAQVKQAVRVPVIGNGGVRGAEDAKAMREQTGCDAVMIGRAAMGNPWVFKSVAEDREHTPPIEERFRVLRRHVDLHLRYAGEHATAREMRKHLGWYLRGLRGSSMVRVKLQSLRSAQDIHDTLRQFEDMLARGPVEASPSDFGAEPSTPRYGA